MIDKKVVDDAYKGLIKCGQDVRFSLIKNLYNVISSVDLENSNISKETLLRIKFIVSLHNEIIANILKDRENFRKNPNYIIDNFYRTLDYTSLYRNIDIYQVLLSDCEETVKLVEDRDSYSLISSVLPEVCEVIDNSIVIVNHEIDNLEEKLANDLVKILGSRKDR